jgi:AcrR family transcriptional regulator
MIDAGLELFGTVGFRDTTIEKICSDAGVGIRAFYEEFGSRENLFREVYDHVIGHAYARVERVLADSVARPADDRLGRFLHELLEAMLIDPRCGRIVSIESSALDRAMDEHRNETLKRFAELGIGALPPATRRAIGNVRLWSLALAGAVNEVVIDHLITAGEADIEALSRDLTDIWIRTLHA